jgi:TolA-binding protein
MSFRIKGLMRQTASVVMLCLCLGGTMAVAAYAPSAQAQLFGDDDKDDPTIKPTPDTVWDKKMLERLARDVRKLQRAVQKVENKNEPPILIEPDPEVVALQATVSNMSRKLDDASASLTRLTGSLEEANFKLTQLTKQNADLSARVDTLTKRLDLAEARVKDIDTALAPPPPPPASTGKPDTDYAQAFALLSSGKLDDAGRAFEAFIQTWPESTQVSEAWFRLGVVRSLKGDMSGAVVALATSLRGWPKNAWAPEANVRLADALVNSNRPNDACAALSEFNKRYAAMATADIKLQAKSLKAKAKCPA